MSVPSVSLTADADMIEFDKHKKPNTPATRTAAAALMAELAIYRYSVRSKCALQFRVIIVLKRGTLTAFLWMKLLSTRIAADGFASLLFIPRPVY